MKSGQFGPDDTGLFIDRKPDISPPGAQHSVGASLLAMVVNDNECLLVKRDAL